MKDVNKTKNIFENLMMQIDKKFKHTRTGSYKTRDRYYEAAKRFCKYLAMKFRLQKFANVKYKHIIAYVLWMQDRGLSASTIKTDLSGLRYTLDLFPEIKDKLPTNKEMELEKRHFAGEDKTWSEKQFNDLIELARNKDMVIYYALQLGKLAGLRIHEVFRLDRAAADLALKTGELTVKGKNGKIRTFPIDNETKELLKGIALTTKRGDKLLVGEGEKTHVAIKRVQNWINYHRRFIKDADGNCKDITFHGLRHTFCNDQYKELKNKGMTDKSAKLKLSGYIGHNRENVIKVYLKGEE